MLFAAGATGRLGNVADGTTVADFTGRRPAQDEHDVILCHLVARRRRQPRRPPGESSFLADALTAIVPPTQPHGPLTPRKGVEKRLWERCEEAGLARRRSQHARSRARRHGHRPRRPAEMSPLHRSRSPSDRTDLTGVIGLIDGRPMCSRAERAVGRSEYRERASARGLMDIVAGRTTSDRSTWRANPSPRELVHAIHAASRPADLRSLAGRKGFGADPSSTPSSTAASPPELRAWTGVDVDSGRGEHRADGDVYAVVYVFNPCRPVQRRSTPSASLSTLASDTMMRTRAPGPRRISTLCGCRAAGTRRSTNSAGGIRAVAKLRRDHHHRRRGRAAVIDVPFDAAFWTPRKRGGHRSCGAAAPEEIRRSTCRDEETGD